MRSVWHHYYPQNLFMKVQRYSFYFQPFVLTHKRFAIFKVHSSIVESIFMPNSYPCEFSSRIIIDGTGEYVMQRLCGQLSFKFRGCIYLIRVHSVSLVLLIILTCFLNRFYLRHCVLLLKLLSGTLNP